MLRRFKALRRTLFRRTGRRSKYRRRFRAFPYMLWVKTQTCSAKFLDCNSPCEGPIEADHAGRRGVGQKCSDYECIPLCRKHHAERTNFSGVFRDWTKERMRAWLAQRVWFTQRLARASRIEIPTENTVSLEVA